MNSVVSGNTNIWKLISALVITSGLTVGCAHAFAWLGWISPLHDRATAVLIVTTIGLLFKLMLGDIATGEFQYNKHGYDLCVLSMGATMSSLSLQLITEINLFPGIRATGLLQFAQLFTDNPVKQNRGLMSVVFIFSSFAALLTARISRAIKFDPTRGKNLLSLINFSIGAAMLGWYVLILVTKE